MTSLVGVMQCIIIIIYIYIYIYIYPYKIITCHNRAYEVSKCTFALTTRSISAGQKSCIVVNTEFLTCYGLFHDVTTRDVSYINKI